MATASLTISANSEGQRSSASLSYTVDNVQKLSVEVATGQTDYEIIVGIDISKLKLFMLSADGTCTIQTNDGTTPDDTFALTSTTPVLWKNGDTAVLTADVTAIYVTNSSGAAVTVELFAATDA